MKVELHLQLERDYDSGNDIVKVFKDYDSGLVPNIGEHFQPDQGKSLECYRIKSKKIVIREHVPLIVITASIR